MTTSNKRRSATIIPFPARRRAMDERRRDEDYPVERVEHLAAQHFSMMACGGAWYHEAAMAEETRESGDED
ncbi:MAG TPA: DUF2735 domain-containing protein [Pseudolabrys sp.]|jgi:hypothetical protein|nr:DUF2735 domain-containing protein [Pseudolabrys sp.]